jgi:hypothetical protein
MTDDQWTEWLRANGFKYEDVERSGRHWLLWIGRAIPDEDRMMDSDGFGIEITPRSFDSERRMMFLRADYAGRYSRFLFCRAVMPDDIVRIIEAIIHPHKMTECQTGYGFLAPPDQVRRMEQERERLDLRIARHYAQATGEDLEKAHPSPPQR